MLKGIYTPVSGGLAQERVLEILANNMANINTPGFKGEDVVFSVLTPEPNKHYNTPTPPANYKVDPEMFENLHGNELSYVGIVDIHRDFTQGPAIETKNPFDVMVQGDAYFQVMTPDGVRHTRDGSFTTQSGGALVTKGGHPVLGEKGNIFLKPSPFEINPQGEVYQNGEFVDKLILNEFSNPSELERTGQNLLFYKGAPENMQKASQSILWQGKLEGSNVNAIKNMTDMIVAHRSYEAYQKTVQNFDSMMDKSSNQIGQVQA